MGAVLSSLGQVALGLLELQMRAAILAADELARCSWRFGDQPDGESEGGGGGAANSERANEMRATVYIGARMSNASGAPTPMTSAAANAAQQAAASVTRCERASARAPSLIAHQIVAGQIQANTHHKQQQRHTNAMADAPNEEDNNNNHTDHVGHHQFNNPATSPQPDSEQPKAMGAAQNIKTTTSSGDHINNIKSNTPKTRTHQHQPQHQAKDAPGRSNLNTDKMTNTASQHRSNINIINSNNNDSSSSGSISNNSGSSNSAAATCIRLASVRSRDQRSLSNCSTLTSSSATSSSGFSSPTPQKGTELLNDENQSPRSRSASSFSLSSSFSLESSEGSAASGCEQPAGNGATRIQPSVSALLLSTARLNLAKQTTAKRNRTRRVKQQQHQQLQANKRTPAPCHPAAAREPLGSDSRPGSCEPPPRPWLEPRHPLAKRASVAAACELWQGARLGGPLQRHHSMGAEPGAASWRRPPADQREPRDQFMALSYNVLSDRLVDTQRFPSSPGLALNWNYRRELILRQLAHYDADLIGLQELEMAQFSEYFEPKLVASHAGLFESKSRARYMLNAELRKRVDGCAIFYKRSRFKLLASHLLEFEKIAMANAHGSEAMINRVSTRDNIAMVAVLEPLGLESAAPPPLIVCNTHIHWDPEFCDVKLVQTIMLMNELESIARHHARARHLQVHQLPLVLLGDFNSLPKSGVTSFLLGGRISASHADFKSFQYTRCTRSLSQWALESAAGAEASGARPEPSSRSPREPKQQQQQQQPIEYEHPFELSSAYELGSMPFTNYTIEFKATIDYIFYSQRSLALLGLLGPLDGRWLRGSRITGFPQLHFPSDHLPLLVKFKLLQPACTGSPIPRTKMTISSETKAVATTTASRRMRQAPLSPPPALPLPPVPKQNKQSVKKSRQKQVARRLSMGSGNFNGRMVSRHLLPAGQIGSLASGDAAHLLPAAGLMESGLAAKPRQQTRHFWPTRSRPAAATAQIKAKWSCY